MLGVEIGYSFVIGWLLIALHFCCGGFVGVFVVVLGCEFGWAAWFVFVFCVFIYVWEVFVLCFRLPVLWCFVYLFLKVFDLGVLVC